jgi:hypothetical protein
MIRAMDPKLPVWATAPSPTDPATDPARLTPQERLVRFVEACELATEVLRHRSDALDVLERRVPLSDESERLWRRLVGEGRRAREAR